MLSLVNLSLNEKKERGSVFEQTIEIIEEEEKQEEKIVVEQIEEKNIHEKNDKPNEVINNSTCCICLNILMISSNLQEKINLNGLQATCLPCEHNSFCYDCIKRWISSVSICPICKQTVTNLVIANDQNNTDTKLNIEVKPTEPQKHIDVATDVSCLDHGFFLEELQRIMQRCTNMQKSLGFRNSNASLGFRRNSSTFDQRKAQLLEEIAYKLDIYQADFIEFRKFDPYAMLKKFYDVQELLDKLSNPQDTSWYDEYFNKEDEYYEEWTCSEEEYFIDDGESDMKFSKKSRKPNGRQNSADDHVKSPQKMTSPAPQKPKTFKVSNNSPNKKGKKKY